jgi:phage/plasmid-like protein (TIGR03299 family)
MSHDIARTNGRPAMAYFGETPWHGLGTRLNKPVNAEQAIEAAGLNYRVELEDLTTSRGISIPSRKAVVRLDTDEVLGVVSDSYSPIQNSECFSFLDSIVAIGEVQYHTAGALGKGEKVWMLAKLPGEIRLKDSDDVTEQYLLLSNSHDGRSALRVFFTPIRVVCANTLGAAERRGRGSGVSIVHKGDVRGRAAEARELLGLAARFYTQTAELANTLASYYPTRPELDRYFEQLYPDRNSTSNSRSKNIRSQLLHLFEHGRGQNIPQTRLTAWSAFNAVTEFVDHHRSSRGPNESTKRANRLNSAWFGSGARIKTEAWSAALDMAM